MLAFAEKENRPEVEQRNVWDAEGGEPMVVPMNETCVAVLLLSGRIVSTRRRACLL